MFTQRDKSWASKRLGTSRWTMGDSGCYVTSVANLLCAAGWPDVTPGDVCDALNANGGFTAGGNAIWAKITEAYPQFRFDGSGTCRLVQLRLLAEYHYEAELADGTVQDPWTGTRNPPAGFRPTGAYSRIAVDQAPVREDALENPPVPAAETASFTVPIVFSVRSTAAVHWRELPSTSSRSMALYPAGTAVECDATVDGESVAGTAKWYRSKVHGWYSTAAYNTHQ